MCKNRIPFGPLAPAFPVSHPPTSSCTIIEFITLVHAIKREVRDPRPSLIDNYNSIVEVRDLIANFEKAH